MDDPLPALAENRDNSSAFGLAKRIRPSRNLLTFAYAVCGLSVAGLMMSTLDWPPNRDVEKLGLFAHLIAEGRHPYTDLVDMNYPGTHLINMTGQFLFGTSYLAVRVQDLLLMLSVMTASWLFLRPLGKVPAYASILLIPWWYFTAYGLGVNYQRDWLIAAAVLWAAYLLTQPHRTWMVLLAGILFGLATMINPLALVPGAVLVAVPLTQGGPGNVAMARRAIRTGALFGASALLIVAATLGWIVKAGGWSSFVWLNTNYLPLYRALDGEGRHIDDGFHMFTAAFSTFLRKPVELLPWSLAIIVVLLRTRPREMRPRVSVLAALAAAGLVAAFLTNKDWAYHFLPFYLPALMLLSIGFGDLYNSRKSLSARKRVALVGASIAAFAIVVVIGRLNPEMIHSRAELRVQTGMFVPLMGALSLGVADIIDVLTRWRNADRPFSPAIVNAVLVSTLAMGTASASYVSLYGSARRGFDTRVESLVSAMETRSSPERSVLILDTASSGFASSIMRTGRPIATSYVYDFYFFQRPDKTITTMRQSLMSQLRAQPPELVVISNHSWGPRPDLASLRSFPDLWEFLGRGYSMVHFDCEATILGRSEASKQSPIEEAVGSEHRECT